MKTMKKVLPLVAFLFVVAAIIMSFFAGLKGTSSGITSTFKNIIWGCKEVDVEGTVVSLKSFIGIESAGISVLPFIGLILMLLGGVGGLLVALLAKKPSAKWILLICGVLVLAGAIMQFFAMQAFVRALVTTMYKEAGVTDKAEIEKAVKEGIENVKKQDPKIVMSVIMGILGCLAGVFNAAAGLLPDKK